MVGNPHEDFRESKLRAQVVRALHEILESSAFGSRDDVQELIEGYSFSTPKRGQLLEPKILALLARVDSALRRKILTPEGQYLGKAISGAAEAIEAQRARRKELSGLPATITVEIPSELIGNLRIEADEMELNTLGVVPEPVAAVLEVLEVAARAQMTSPSTESIDGSQNSLDMERSAWDQIAAEDADPIGLDITGSILDGDLAGFERVRDIARTADFSDGERPDSSAQLRAEISETISSGASKVAEAANRLNERYGPLGERLLQKAISAAKGAVAPQATEKRTAEAQSDAQETTESRVLDEAFSSEGFDDAGEREIDLQALREKLASTPKPLSSTTGSRSNWSQPRDQLAQLIYDAQHPDNGSKWLTTVDGSPNIVSYEAADAVLTRFPDLFASSDTEPEPGAENSSERSAGDSQSDGQNRGIEHGSGEEEDSDSKIEDFPLPVPPAESDLGRLRYLQRALDLDDFEDSFRRDDTLAELLELLPDALEEIRYLRDNEGEVQKSFLETLEKLRGAVSTSSVRHAWEAYEGARDSRNLIYESRQEERAKVRRLEGELEDLRAKLSSSEDDSRSAAEKLAAWTEEANRKEREAVNGSSVRSYNRWAETQRELPLSAGRISYRSADSQRELGHVTSFMVSGIPMAVRISEQEGTTLKLLELTPQGSESPLFRKEICATGFLTEEKLRRIAMDTDGWLGNDAVEAASQSDPAGTESDSSRDENAADGNDR